ncbi:MAG: hypothetical protein WDZ83_20060 [Rhizobiaceae bacterium]
MQQHVCDINSHAPQFFVDNGVAYDPVENKPRFWIHDQYWIPYLSDDKWPLYVQDGKYIYDYPREEGPVFYYR